MSSIKSLRSKVTIIANQIYSHQIEKNRSEAFKMAWREVKDDSDSMEIVRFTTTSGKATVRVVDARETIVIRGERLLMTDIAKFLAGKKNCKISCYVNRMQN